MWCACPCDVMGTGSADGTCDGVDGWRKFGDGDGDIPAGKFPVASSNF